MHKYKIVIYNSTGTVVETAELMGGLHAVTIVADRHFKSVYGKRDGYSYAVVPTHLRSRRRRNPCGTRRNPHRIVKRRVK
jgi:hypothetical protein